MCIFPWLPRGIFHLNFSFETYRKIKITNNNEYRYKIIFFRVATVCFPSCDLNLILIKLSEFQKPSNYTKCSCLGRMAYYYWYTIARKIDIIYLYILIVSASHPFRSFFKFFFRENKYCFIDFCYSKVFFLPPLMLYSINDALRLQLQQTCDIRDSNWRLNSIGKCSKEQNVQNNEFRNHSEKHRVEFTRDWTKTEHPWWSPQYRCEQCE